MEEPGPTEGEHEIELGEVSIYFHILIRCKIICKLNNSKQNRSHNFMVISNHLYVPYVQHNIYLSCLRMFVEGRQILYNFYHRTENCVYNIDIDN